MIVSWNTTNACNMYYDHCYRDAGCQAEPLWLNEGAALYLTNGTPRDHLIGSYRTRVPTYKQTQTTSPIEFNEIGGYDFACTYIEYLDATYGWEKVVALLKTADYEKTLGKSAQGIYDDWVKFLARNY